MASSLEVVLKLRDNMTGGFKKAEGTVQRFTKNTKSAFKSLFNIPNLIAGTAAVAVARTFYGATTALEAMETRMRAAVVTNDNFRESMKFTSDLAKKFGLDIKATTNGFASFAASSLRSGLSMNQTKQIFEDVSTTAASLKLNTEQVNRVFMAFEQMAGKGRVQLEELKNQLGDSGLAGTVSIAAKSLGVTNDKLFEMLKKGQVISKDFLPEFAKKLKEELGGASEEAANSLQANMTKVGNAIFKINSSLGSIFAKDASQGLGALEKVLTGIADGIERSAGKIRAGVLTVVLPIQILISAFKIAGDVVAGLVMYLVNAGVWAFKTFSNVVDVTAQSVIQLVRVMAQPVKLLEKDFRDSVVNTFANMKSNFENIVNDSKTAAGEFAGIWKVSGQEFDKNIQSIADAMLNLSSAYDKAGQSAADMKTKASGSTITDPFGGSAGTGATENFSGISMTTGLGFQAKINAQNELMKQSKMRYLEEIGQLEQLSVEASIKRANMMRDAYQNIATSLQTAFADAFTIIVDLNTSAAEKIRGVMRSMFRYITQMLIQYLAKMAALRFAQLLLTGGTGGGALIGSSLINLFAGNKGYATGTNNAQPGWHMVGENGPELMRFRGGEQVRNNYQSRNMGQAGPISINTTIQGNADSNTVRAINDSNEKLARQIEDLVRKRYLPAGAFGL